MEKIANFKVGDIHNGVINKVTDFGIFVTLDEEITGLVHVSEFGDASKGPNEMFRDDKVKVKILEINEGDRSLKLSLRVTEKTKC